MDVLALWLAIGAVIGSIPVFLVAWYYRNERVIPVGRRAFVAMGFGLLGISAFYCEIAYHGSSAILVPFSRLLWAFIVLSSVGMAGGVLAYRKQEKHRVKKCRGQEK